MDERIDDYFNNRLTGEEKAAFEHELAAQPRLQEDVAWYLAAREAARNAALDARHDSWKPLRPQPAAGPRFRFGKWYLPAAALLLIAFFAWFFMLRAPSSPTLQQRAAAYASAHFSKVPVRMDGTADSLQQGLNLYNQGRYDAALLLFERLLQRRPDSPEILENAGLAALRLGDFRRAAGYFERQGTLTGLYANPGKFYQAIALLHEGDTESIIRAEKLLKEVVAQNLTGKKTASEWLENTAKETR